MKTQSALAYSRPTKTKLFYRINEVSELTGVKPHVLRYWETEFPELSPEKDASDHRRYRMKDVQTVQAIRKLLWDDRFTIKGARTRLKEELRVRTGAAPEPARTEEIVQMPLTHRDVGAEARMNAAANRSTKPSRNGAPKSTLAETLVQLRREVGDLIKILDA